MSKIKLSDYIAKRLKEVYKVEHFFMVSGGGAMHLNDSLGRCIEYTANHHEQACSIAAEGYSRVNQKLSVVNVTTGPGGLNCLNGVFGQWTDSVPVLYLSGQVKFSTTMGSCPEVPLRQLGDQEVDIISVVRPLTKYSHMITEPKEIKYHIDKAIFEATTGRFGPVWLDIPMNVQAALIEESELIDFIPPSAKVEIYDEKIEILKNKLKSASRPIIVAGHGIRLSGMENEFLRLIEKSNIPIVTTFNGFDILPSNHKNYVGRIGTIGQRAGNFALQNADLLICLGTRNNIRQVSYNSENFAKNAYKVVVDIDKSELLKHTLTPDLSIQANLKEFLPLFSDVLGQTLVSEDWLLFCKNLEVKYSFKNTYEYSQSGDEINPYFFTRKLSELLSENDILVMANGSACVCTFQTAEVKNGQRFILNSGNASMGYALPASIGACIHSPKRKIVCLEGDGSIMMNIQELQTIKHSNLPVKIFVINNSGYSSIRQTQKNFFNGHMTGSGDESGVSVPSFVKVADAFGIKSIRIEKASDLEPKITEVLNSEGPMLCEVMVQKEYSFVPKLSARKLEDGTMVSPSLEDMFPFLEREEYLENLIND